MKNGQVEGVPTEKQPATIHHHYLHGMRQGQSVSGQVEKHAEQVAPVVVPPKAKMSVSSQAVLDSVANLARHHLGDFIYEPGLRAERLVPENAHRRGFSSNPKPLPWEMIKGKENCTLTVKIARVHLMPAPREEITARRYLWGTDIYTDDSDVVAACIHSGWLRGEWSEEVDASALDLVQGKDAKRGKSRNQGMSSGSAYGDSEGLITAPPSSGPMSVPPDRDLHVTVIILPRLVKYASTTRFGITSRDFGGDFGERHAIHDGLSFLIHSIRWVENGAQPQCRLRGQARRERMRKAMAEMKGSFGNVTFDRDVEKVRATQAQGEISGNWSTRGTYDKADREKSERRASEGDKENHAGTGNQVGARVEVESTEQQPGTEGGATETGAASEQSNENESR